MKRFMVIVLSILMLVSVLGACSSTPAEVPADTPATAPSTSAPVEEPAEAPAEEPADEPAEAPVEEPVEAPEIGQEGEVPKGFAPGSATYPLCAPGEITIEYWTSAGEDVLTRTEKAFADNVAYRELEKITGIQVDFSVFAASNYATQYSLMLASEEYPDTANVTGATYAGGNEKAIEDEVYVDLSQYTNLMPNYMRWVNHSIGNQKNAYTDSGMMPTMAMVFDRTQPSFYGYAIRQDWLDDLGLAMPTTMDEIHEVLLAFKEHKTNGEAPMDSNTSGFGPFNFLCGAYNVDNFNTNCGIIVKNDVLESSWRSQGLYDFIATMAQWFDEGLIDPDFAAIGWGWNTDRLGTGVNGMLPAMFVQVGDWVAQTGMAPEDMYLTLMPYPTAEGYDRKVFNLGKYSSGMRGESASICVFADSAYIEPIIQWYDYRYSEPGYILTNYGVEGETFDYDESGTPVLRDIILNNPEMGSSLAQEYYLMHNAASVFLLDREENVVNAEGLAYTELWNVRGEWNCVATMTYTPEEGEVISAKASDINTATDEFVAKCIMGQIELNESTWNEFQDQLTAMGIDEVIEIMQAAYDRFLAR